MGDYTKEATADNPALMIYVVNISGSMANPFGDHTRMDDVTLNLERVFDAMVRRCTRGLKIRPRYVISIIGYSDDAHSVLPTELMSIDQVAELGRPEFVAEGFTNTADAFQMTLDLLKREVPRRKNDPHPSCAT